MTTALQHEKEETASLVQQVQSELTDLHERRQLAEAERDAAEADLADARASAAEEQARIEANARRQALESADAELAAQLQQEQQQQQ